METKLHAFLLFIMVLFTFFLIQCNSPNTYETDNIPSVSLLDPSNGENAQSKSITLTWKEVSVAEEYEVQVANDYNFIDITLVEMVQDTSFTIAELEHDQTYYWRVRAIANENNGLWSDIWEFITKKVDETDDSKPLSFVRVQNGRFVVDSEVFRFAGTNAYYLPNFEKVNPNLVDRTLDEFQTAGITVIRMWAFYDGVWRCGENPDPANENVIQTAPGEYNEQALRDFDHVIAKGKERNIRFLLPLINFWDDLGGICQYNTWAGASDPSRNLDFFLNNENTQKWFRDYISMLLNRVNTETGIAYKDEPAIFGWQIINEGRNNGQEEPQIIRDWYQQMLQYIKSIDSNHLVSTGEEGLDHYSLGHGEHQEFVHPNYSSEAYSNSWVIRADAGTSFVLNSVIPESDFLTFHWYPRAVGFHEASFNQVIQAQHAWLSDHQKIANDAGKPLVLAEYGFSSPTYTPDQALYEDLWEQAEQLRLDGTLMWQFVVDDTKCPENGGNICWPGGRKDRDLYNGLRDHIQTMNSMH